MRKAFGLPVVVLALSLPLAGVPASVSAAAPAPLTVSVPASAGWVDTGIRLGPGRYYVLTATGVASCTGPDTGPSGPCPSNADGVNPYTGYFYGVPWGPCTFYGCWAVPSLPVFSLIARVGAGAPFFVGSGPALVNGTGELYLAYNDDLYDDNYGGYSVTLAPPPAGLSMCQDGAWRGYGVFGNEGQCMSLVATKGWNLSG